MSIKFNPFTGQFDLVEPLPNQVGFKRTITEDLTIPTDYTYLQKDLVLSGNAQIIIQGTGELYIL